MPTCTTPLRARQGACRRALRVCPICQVALEEARKRQEAMQALPPVEAPESLVQGTLERIVKQKRIRVTSGRWTTWGLLTAAAWRSRWLSYTFTT